MGCDVAVWSFLLQNTASQSPNSNSTYMVFCVWCTTGQQLETERERALAHEEACTQLQQRIASLQELRQHQQLLHGQQVNSLLMQIKEAQNQMLDAAELRRKAEGKVLTARELSCPSTITVVHQLP